VKVNVVTECIRTVEYFAGALLRSGIVDDQFNPFVASQVADDFPVNPWDRFKLSGPIVAMVGPSQPSGVMRFPFGRHAEALGCSLVT
jgi:hypothetical protein